MKTRVLCIARDAAALPLIDGTGGDARAVVWPGVGARHRSMHHITLAPGARTVSLRHPDSEAVYYVTGGAGAAHDLDTGTVHALRAGSVVFMTPGTRYRLAADPVTAMTCVGGPCPPDPALYASLDHARRAARPEASS
jgi:quercetin dioxygenase-like cupin family protein